MATSQNYFALPGDSGALAFNEDGPVGLVHAVKKASGETYFCKASNIEKLLEVSFAPPLCSGSYTGLFDPTRFPTDPKERFEVLISGISIGHKNVTAGTLGAFVWDIQTDELLGLTCAHIAAPPGAVVGDPIYQPGPLDIRTKFHREPTDDDIAGYLDRWIPISFDKPNLVDAALFRPVRPVWPCYVLGYGERPLTGPIA
jgi:hypothetical protein